MKTLSSILSTVVILYAGSIWAANTYTATTNGVTWTYALVNGEASLGSGEYYGASAIPYSTTGDLNIPSTLDGYPLTRIGDYAFYNCSKLMSVTLPDSVTSIGAYAFYNCSGLTSVTIPNSVTNVGTEAFYGCRNLERVYIGDLAAWCSMRFDDADYYGTSYREGTNPLSYARDGLYLNGIKVSGKLVIPNEVTSIGAFAFANCSGITSLVIPNTVTHVGSGAFSGCSNLKSVTVPQCLCGTEDRWSSSTPFTTAFGGGQSYYSNYSITNIIVSMGVTNIGRSAFSSCYNLKYVTIPSTVRNVGTEAFYGCRNLERVYIDDLAAWCSIRFDDADYYGTSYREGTNPLSYARDGLYLNDIKVSGKLVIPNEVTSIGAFAFANCSGITSLVIPNTVTHVGSGAFSGCSNLKSVTVPQCLCGTEDRWSSSTPFTTAFGGGQSYYSNYSITNIIVSMGVTNIGRSAFSSCYNLKCVTIPSTVRNVGTEAFYGCRNLERVYIDDLAAWCSIRFGEADSYGTSYREGTNPLSYARDGLYLNGIKVSGELVIPNEVTSIGAFAFANCNGITSLVIPNTVTNIGNGAFSGCSNLKNVTIPQYLCDNDIWSFRGRFYDVFSSNYSYYETSITNLIIAEGVTNIADRAFDTTVDLLRNLTSVTIPRSVKSIGRSAFPSSSNLQYINISDLAAWCVISFPDLFSHPFWFGSRGTLVLNGVPIQGNLEIPDGVTSIGDYAFAFLRNITSVTIPPSVTDIGTGAFLETYRCTAVNISDLSAWCKIRFEDLYSNPLYVGNGRLCLNGEELIGRLVVPNDVDVIGRAAFCNCSGLTEVVIGNATTEIGERAFQGCSGLMTIIVGEDNPAYKSENGLLLSKDGKSLVQGVNGNVMIPNSVTNIASYAFCGCTNLTSIAMTDSVTGIGSYAFYGCGGLASVTIPGGVTSIGDSAFCNCANLRSFMVAEGSTTYISVSGLLLSKDGKDILFGVNRDVTIPDGVTNIANKAFYYCRGLTSLTIPDSVTSIGDDAFYNCSGLTSLTIGNGVVNIGDYSFYGCSGLESVTIPDSATSIGDDSFYGCSGLTSVTIGNGVTKIGQSAFYGLTNLTKVTIGNSVKTIDAFAFWSCKNLDSVTFTGDAPAASSAFSFVKSGCVAYVKRTANGFPAEGAKWNDLTVMHYGGSIATGTMTEMEGCEYIIVANDDETLTERDITFTTVVGNTLVDTTKGYNVKVATDGKSATARLKAPTVGAVAVVECNAPLAFDGSDPSGALVVVNENELAAKPTVKNGEEVGALPVTAVPGLYYQAAWGSDLGHLTPGAKVQAMTDTLYLGVIKQTGTSGFYKVTVSEQ